MSVPARGSCEETCNEQVDRIVKQRIEFGLWWREFAPPRGLDTAYMQSVAWESWKAGFNQAKGEK
jgi:hypothetical protein